MAAPPAPPYLALLFGEDDFAVKNRARSLFDDWSKELGGMDHEVIDAQVGNSSDAFRALAKLREALNTLPFFGGGKAIWMQGCSFLGEDRTSASQAVIDACAELAGELARFPWGSVRLVISAGKVDKRRSFFKTLSKSGRVEEFTSWADDDQWADRAETAAMDAIRARGKEITPAALACLAASVGPQPRLLLSEVEKLSLFVGDRKRIEESDVVEITTRNKHAKAFALAEAVADRNLPKALRCLDEEMWSMQFDKDKSEFGLLAGLTSKIRQLIGVSELLRLKWIKPEADWKRYASQLQRIDPSRLPEDKRFNPAAMHPYVMQKAVSQARHYKPAELVRAMELLLACNRRLIFSALDARLVLQQTLVDIVGGAAEAPRAKQTGTR
ncbi:MAG: DNA polymerase III subunit delta [Verrucomicrobia bacterium]|nr:DNA polymerase III subunit delta [Verrucomicrobiota bacterium]MBI3869077.1 DNA polymerase III subunit delta [Verrucomicrobiota bacterium]